jgi:mannan endo-1,4-beta-mannosidase
MKRLIKSLLLIFFFSTLTLHAQITLNPVREVNNKNATKEVKELYDYFLSIYGKNIISGQTEFQYCEFVSGVTGRSPVICAFDFVDFTGNKSLNVDKAIEWGKDHKGIVAFQWHWRDPMTKNGNFYSYPNYPTGTKFDVSKIFYPDSPEYKAMIEDIDLISSHLKRLQDNNIPVLWRPLHEATGNQWGGWFWWSTGTNNPAASCKKLWEVMYDRMTNFHGLNNLIWIWNTEGTPREDVWYPGDDTVDLLGTDTYNGTPNSTFAKRFEDIHLRHKGTKMIAMTENGSVPDSKLLLAEKIPWLYFCTWGNMIMDQEINPRDLLRRVFNDPYVITNTKLNVDTIPDPVNKPTLPNSYEAEDAILSGSLNVYKVYDGYTGSGYVGNFSDENDKITFKIYSDEAGIFNLYIAYHIPKGWGYKNSHISVNGANRIEVRFENKDDEGFHETPPLSINLNKGQNEIVLSKNWGYYEIDYIRIPILDFAKNFYIAFLVNICL